MSNEGEEDECDPKVLRAAVQAEQPGFFLFLVVGGPVWVDTDGGARGMSLRVTSKAISLLVRSESTSPRIRPNTLECIDNDRDDEVDQPKVDDDHADDPVQR